jgi:heme/copper-type cytochrome/quinol oxidase subunit 1
VEVRVFGRGQLLICRVTVHLDTAGRPMAAVFRESMNGVSFSLLSKGDLNMLSAKLFAVLAVLQLGFALLESRTAHQSVDVFFHATYFVIPIIHLRFLLALTSACFALIYFAAFRWLLHPLSNSLGLTHFVMATIGLVLLSVYLFAPGSAANDLSAVPVPSHGTLLAAVIGALSFLFGCATLAVNCTWAAIAVFRSH